MEVQEMAEKELITVTIDKYTDLQRIKKANGDNENIKLGACPQLAFHG